MSVRSAIRWQNFMRTRGCSHLLVNQRRPVQADFMLRTKGSDFWTYEEVMRSEVYRCVAEAVVEPTTIIDCGANIGLASLYFAHRCRAANIIAVEANRSTYLELERNIQLSKLEKIITPVLGAVWVRNTAMATRSPDSDDHFSAFRVEESVADGDSVPGLTVPDLLAMTKSHHADLVKIDIEGAEEHVFGESEDLGWLRHVDALAVEFHGDARKVTDFDRRIVREGFQVLEGGDEHTTVALRQRLK